MPHCAAFGCINNTSRVRKSFFRIPNPATKPELCRRWLNGLSLERISFDTFVHSKDHVVCEDHFTADCFVEDIKAKLMGKPPRKMLRDDAVPTLFAHRPRPVVRESSERRIAAAESRAYIKSVLEQPSSLQPPDLSLPGPSSGSSSAPQTKRGTDILQEEIDEMASEASTYSSTQRKKKAKLMKFSLVTETQTMTDNHVSVGTTPSLEMRDATIQHPPDEDSVLKDHSYVTQPYHVEMNPSSDTSESHNAEEGSPADAVSALSKKDGSARSHEILSPQKSSFPHPEQLPSLDVPNSGDTVELWQGSDTTPYQADDEASLSDSYTKLAGDESATSSEKSALSSDESKSASDKSTSGSGEASSSSEESKGGSDQSKSGSEEIPAGSKKSGSEESSSDESGSEESSSEGSGNEESDGQESGGEGSGSEECAAGSEGSGIEDAADGKNSGCDESSSKKYLGHDKKSDSEGSVSKASAGRSGESASSEPVPFGPTDTDPDWIMSGEESSSTSEAEESTEQKYCHDRKFIVFELQIDALLYSLQCEKCQGPVHDIQKRCVGSVICVTCICSEGHEVKKWESQPRIGKAAVGNLIGAAAILFTGNTFKGISQLFHLMNLQFIQETLHYDVQRNFLLPVVNQFYIDHKKSIASKFTGKDLWLSGDGRCDSPGYNAKYCSYSLMTMDSEEIIDFELVQVSQAKSSVHMEKVAFETCLKRITESGFKPAVVATDRHVSIRKLLKDDYSDIDHQFDVWHLTKSIAKKLTNKARQKGCEELGPRIPAVKNHLWWSAQHCNGDWQMLLEMWQSIVHHVTNVHHWNSGDLFCRCRYDPLSEEEQRVKKWLTPGSVAHKALSDIVFDKRLSKDLKHVTQACHTGSLEVFHNVLLKYCPKRLHFTYPTMLGRLQLAVLDHNLNVGRKQATVSKQSTQSGSKGSLRYKYCYSKAAKEWISKPIMEGKSYEHLCEMLVDV
ncbi:THAP domain-containing protein 1 [Holothuria leucospilota]|uniref:THAP domain-containing protein 1 n=1 Tax=Holothuria leucospilota TaxID=206669 RepID=A0A9Q1CP25_HOLLE|nr:THAP domain-containing protein 1 [Holothuria leucospilota]